MRRCGVSCVTCLDSFSSQLYTGERKSCAVCVCSPISARASIQACCLSPFIRQPEGICIYVSDMWRVYMYVGGVFMGSHNSASAWLGGEDEGLLLQSSYMVGLPAVKGC